MPRVYLISKWGDVLLGLSTGVFAYALYERRLHRPEGERLVDLVRWKLDQRAALNPPKTPASQAEQEGWAELERELKLKEQEALKAGVKA
ncbi:hypothetical protein JCM10449v2_003644 [Rhodotorula kratochvilovae]